MIWMSHSRLRSAVGLALLMVTLNTIPAQTGEV